MRALVVYHSVFGNTEQIARAIGTGLTGRMAEVQIVPVSALAPESIPADLLIVGGPTQRHRMSPELEALLARYPRGSLRGVRAATFDTRYRMSRLLSGSAAAAAAARLRRAGCHLITDPESFFIERDAPAAGEKRRHGQEHLEPGEIERATEWARRLPI